MRAAAATALLAAGTQLVDFGVYDRRVRVLDMNTHASVFGVVSLLALVAAGAAAAILAGKSGSRSRATLALPALLGLLLALRVLHPAHVAFYALPFGAATLLLLWRLDAHSSARRVVRIGCVTLVASYAVRVVGGGVVSVLGYGKDTWPRQIELVLQHSSELAGWLLVAIGIGAACLESARASAARRARAAA